MYNIQNVSKSKNAYLGIFPKHKIKLFVFYIIITLVTVAVILPFAWMLSTSFKGTEAIRTIPIRWIPKNPTFGNYIRIFNMSSYNFWQASYNSFLLAITCTIVGVFSATTAAFVFSKVEFKGQDKLFLVYLATMMIPATVTMIPNYTILKGLNLLDSFAGLIILSLNNTFGMFLMRQTMMGIHNAYLEAALMDGASMWSIFFKIMMPMCRPTLATLLLMSFMGSWNSYLQPLLVLSSNNKQTLPLVLATLNGQMSGKENVTMAGAVLTIIPILVVYIFLNKYVDYGLDSGGIKA
jgi:multiple sugar transport system permease protein